MEENKVICYCANITYTDIKNAMDKGCKTVYDIKKSTGAGTICGRCIGMVEQIVDKIEEENK